MVLLVPGMFNVINHGVELNITLISTLFLFFMLSSDYVVGSEIVFYEKPNTQETVFMIILVVIGISIAIGATYFLINMLFSDRRDKKD